ncbi:MAG: ADP-forming succinate--CoA ligase subunit beta [Deltaproteobacteria bacterium]|nr:ADP-forming succinate--CoA ligase subunit beta [Deltaproteobacteria bacterium]
MNIHEFQAKELLRRYGVPVPVGKIAFTPAEAEEAAREFLEDRPVCVVKAQIHAGGRGKAGGVKIAKTKEEAADIAKELLGKILVTHQTGPEGKEVQKVYVEEGCDIATELYLGIVIDRSTQKVCIMASREGGVEIEEVAEKSPEKILKEFVDPAVGFMPYQGRNLAFALGIEKKSIGKAVKFMTALYNAFVDMDCSMAEINPLVVTGDGDIIALDAKISFDESALFRHKDIEELRDLSEEDPKEVAAARFNLNYVSLDGSIGCMVNGAGLAMATMDIIQLHGGTPANFLDVGGGADTEQVTAAFKLIMSDEKVKAMLVNIFGGIMKCDIIADGIVQAAKDVGVKIPLVVRLQGTNVEKGREILEKSGLNIIAADKMEEAAEKVVAAVKG